MSGGNHRQPMFMCGTARTGNRGGGRWQVLVCSFVRGVMSLVMIGAGVFALAHTHAQPMRDVDDEVVDEGGSTEAGDVARAFVHEPPRYEAFVLDTLPLPPKFEPYDWTPFEIADDGTVYGNVLSDPLFHGRKTRMFKSSIAGGTEWLFPGEPNNVEVRPIAASTSGVVLIYAFYWPQDWIYIPGQGVQELNSLHPDIFFANDMNNDHLLAGMVGVQPNNRAVVYDDGVGFTFLAEPEASAMALNDEGSVIGHLDSGFGWINMRVWYADGGVDNFVLPRERTQPISVTGMNRHGEVVGTHVRPDPETDRSRWGGWIWTEATGLNEIPFLHRDDEGGNTVYIFGISDDGWVFGNEPYKPDGGERIGDYFLWHPESGFWHLADLYDWESQFTGVGDQNGNAAINANGWLTLENYVVGEHLARSIILVPNE